MNKSVLIILFLLASGSVFAQDPKLDRLEMWFDQGNYGKVVRKSKRLMKDAEYKSHALPYLWNALGTVSLQEKRGNALYKSLIESSKLFQTFTQQENASYYLVTYNDQILDYQEAFLETIAELKTSNKGRSEKLYDCYQETFNTSVPFNEIVEQPLPDPEPIKDLDPKDNSGSGIVKTAKKYLGVPYKWGGTNEKGFDCSGYTGYVMGQHGITLPRKASDQARKVKKIKSKQASPGDLVFFGSGKKVTHVGIVTSNPGEQLSMIHASSSKGIMISNIENSSYWKPRLLFVGQIATP